MKVSLVSILFFISVLSFGQNQLQSNHLLQVNNRQISTDEFKQVYAKNSSIIDDKDKLTVDEYFELFKTYHLKLEAAYQHGLDKDETFLKEYQKYYKQLADNYIANGEVTDKMIEETYHRTVNEVKASHILISPPANANTDEWEKAFNLAWDVKEMLDAGADFDSLAKTYSKDPSVQNNNGDLGWFKAFKMVFPFEDATYNLAINEISNPVQTQFGYHIIKKTGERKSVGKMKVAHIMYYLKQKDTLQSAEDKINNIYQKVLAGEDFHELAKQFSQDKNTASKGGEMNAFGLGDLNSPIFTEVAFSLENNGDISAPFKTRFGWHIVKRLETIPPKSYEEVKEDLRKKIKTSDRSKMLNNRIQEKIESYYTVSKDPDAVAFISTLMNDDVFKGKWKLDQNQTFPDKNFLVIDEAVFAWKDLAFYIEKNQRAAKNKTSIEAIAQELADTFVYAELVEYHKKNLPELDAEFAATINEYKNGLLLFEIMQNKVWNKAKEDTLQLKEFYNNNSTNYKTKEKVEAEILSFSQKKQAKKFLKKLKNNNNFSELAQTIDDAIYQGKEVLDTDSSAISPKLNFEKGVSKIIKNNGQYVVYHITEKMPVRILDFEDVQGRVISDYQEKIEKEWVNSLKETYKLTVNEEELAKVKLEFEK